MNGKAFCSQCDAQSSLTYLCSFQLKGETEICQIFHCVSGEAPLLTPVKVTGWLQWAGRDLDVREGALQVETIGWYYFGCIEAYVK